MKSALQNNRVSLTEDMLFVCKQFCVVGIVKWCKSPRPQSLFFYHYYARLLKRLYMSNIITGITVVCIVEDRN